MSETEKVIGIKVVKRQPPDTEMDYEFGEIPAETLVEMTRCSVRPILEMEEVKSLAQNYFLINGFAATTNVPKGRR